VVCRSCLYPQSEVFHSKNRTKSRETKLTLQFEILRNMCLPCLKIKERFKASKANQQVAYDQFATDLSVSQTVKATKQERRTAKKARNIDDEIMSLRQERVELHNNPTVSARFKKREDARLCDAILTLEAARESTFGTSTNAQDTASTISNLRVIKQADHSSSSKAKINQLIQLNEDMGYSTDRLIDNMERKPSFEPPKPDANDNVPIRVPGRKNLKKRARFIMEDDDMPEQVQVPTQKTTVSASADHMADNTAANTVPAIVNDPTVNPFANNLLPTSTGNVLGRSKNPTSGYDSAEERFPVVDEDAMEVELSTEEKTAKLVAAKEFADRMLERYNRYVASCGPAQPTSQLAFIHYFETEMSKNHESDR
jgi:hypothetical protein